MTRSVRLLAIDVGTTAVKAATIVDGLITEITEAPLTLTTPAAGWSEQQPAEWWRATVAAVRRLRPGVVDAIACTGQMQDLITCAGEEPVGAALLYSDQRAVAEHEVLLAELPGWAEAAGALPDATTIAAKWRWLERHDPDRVAATDTVLFGAHSFVVLQLTGVAACDPTTAATTGLYDQRSGEWWEPTRRILSPALPAIVDPCAAVGSLRAAAAAELGLEPGLPVVHAPGDAVATTVGVVGSTLDDPYAYVGTSGWIAVNRRADGAGPVPGVIWLPGTHPGTRVAAAPMLTAGAAADWARDALLGGVSVDGLDRLAAPACAAAEGVMFLPHLDGVRLPAPDPDATGVLIGVRRTTASATVAAAVYEGVAHALRQTARAVAPATQSLSVCGGGSRSDVWMQILADVTGWTVHRVVDEHAAVRGAASCALEAMGHPPLGAAERHATFTPRAERLAAHRRIAPLFDGLVDALGPTFGGLTATRDRR